uniref:Carbamoyltransferase n=1 Tax=Candidatus Kentrum sp. TUN TaxID=2126343 RepID=A0A450ZLV6_9GAMM|nr:MAG: carbamoyltransferase [Candidatus Kentron sp. TUN]VFK55232.1 MAG: carbamoyltransferase [Candidatus Kentron sp. TUN]VFK58655.1 MAG: carbamoyltransferase [Candidatus Kentron sp. TUN]
MNQHTHWETVGELDRIVWPKKEDIVILGLNAFYHDSSAALYKAGEIVAAAQEERFTRKKHDNSFPLESIEYCLDAAGSNLDEVDLVVFTENALERLEREISSLENYQPITNVLVEKTLQNWVGKTPKDIEDYLRSAGFAGEIAHINHHASHIYSAYFTSGYDESAVFSVDGIGEKMSTLWGYAEGKNVRFKRCITYPHSIGLLYSTITGFLGFRANSGEYKVMGLAPCSLTTRETNPYYEKMQKLVRQNKDGSYQLNLKYFAYEYDDKMFSNEMISLFEMEPRKEESELTKDHEHIASALQMVTEDLLLSIIDHVQKKTRSKNLCIAGGVGLNSVFNGKILRDTDFENVYIQPAAGDDGTVIGGVLYAALRCDPNFQIHKQKMTHAFLGPRYSDGYIKEYLDRRGVDYIRFTETEALLEETANLLYDNQVIGWFQGRMEWGPRALGARSILGNPCNPHAKELLNTKVKHREEFRPFAPVVCDDDALTYFHCDEPLPKALDFMLMVYPVREQWREKIPSVTHVDGSGRLQTIAREQNSRYYDLIKKFGARSGIPILINTSFNIRGEPIVCTPHDAYRCMMGTGIDYLVMGNYLIKRSDNPQHIWDAEAGID